MKYANLHRWNAGYKIFLMAAVMLAGSLISIGQTTVAVAPLKMNILYIGIDNPVSVAASGSSDDKVTVSVKGGGGTISKTAAGLYNLRVLLVTDECVVNVYSEGKLAGSSTFRVRNLPLATAMVGGMCSGSNVSRDAFRKQAGVSVFVKDSPLEMKNDMEVISFTLSIDAEKDIMTADCKGSLFSAQAKQYLEKYAIPGHMLTIDKIRVRNQGGSEFTAPSLVYYIY